MSRLIQLPSGTFIAPGAIQMVEARSLMRPHVDHAGQEWPAMVCIETRNQVVRVPCASFVDAENLRDAIGDLVNASHANAQARHAESAPPARGTGQRIDGAALPAQMMAPRQAARGAFAEAS